MEFILNMNGYALRSVPEYFQDQKICVMIAIQKFGGVVQYASDRLKNDEEIMIKAIS